MTRVYIYSAGLVAVLLATAMTLTSILSPNWVAFSVTANTGRTFYRTIGLHESCSSEAKPSCRRFPADSECQGDERYFCSMWRTTGFLMSFATVLELVALVGFLVIIAGGKAKRDFGWRILSGLLTVIAAIEFSAMGIVAYLFDHDGEFDLPGWGLDSSWILCSVSAGVTILVAASLAISAKLLPEEEGYEFLRDLVGA